MSTLETQYKNFLKDNPNAKIHFEAWKKINARLIEQALINMMKADEESGLYDEPKKDEIMERFIANAKQHEEPKQVWFHNGEIIDIKQETLEEAAEIWVHNRFTKQIKDEDIYASKSSIVQSHILFAKWMQERSYSEEEVLEILNYFKMHLPLHWEFLFNENLKKK